MKNSYVRETRLVLVSLIILGLVACGGGSSSSISDTVAEHNSDASSEVVDPQPEATPTPTPTSAPEIENTPEPELSPTPTATPEIELTPQPDSTPTPTATPDVEENTPSQLNISASLVKGPVVGANCELYEITETQSKGGILAFAQSLEVGTVSFGNVSDYQGLALIECTGGAYVDEATETALITPNLKLRSIINITGNDGDALHYSVTPLTEIATLLAEQDPQGYASALNDVAYNQKVAKAFGIDAEIIRCIPSDLLNEINTENSDEAKYGLAVSLVSALIYLEEELDSLEILLDELANDLRSEFVAGNEFFSQEKREKLGEAVDFYTGFGSLVNSSLFATQVRQQVRSSGNFISPMDDEPLKTFSLIKPLDEIQSEIVSFIQNNNMQRLPAAPSVSEEMYALGQALAFDKILSGNRDTSCLSCHHPLLASGDARSLSLGAGGEGLGQGRSGGEVIARHAQPLFNLDLFEKMFWDGRIQLDEQGNLSTPADATGDITQAMIDVFFAEQSVDGFQGYQLVAAQAMFPVADSAEMRGEALSGNELAGFAEDDFAEIWSALMARLGAIPEYVELFEAAYPGVSFESMSFAHAANAIAAFEIAAFNFRDNPWQQVINDIAADGEWDNTEILDEESTRGAHLFFETGCVNCHSGSVMSDFDFHNIATVQFGPGKGNGESGFEDWGRELVTGNAADRAKFRTAPLFNIALTAPYAHLGQFNDLWSHIQIYAIPERFWLNLYTGYDRIVGGFVHESDFNNQVSEAEQALFREFPVPSFDGEAYGFFRTLDYIETQVERSAEDVGRLTLEEGKRLGDGELNPQRRIMLPFMEALTDPRATDLSHLIPSAVPSGLPVENLLD